MRSVLLAVVVALCAVLAPAVTPVSVGAPPPKSKTSAPKEEAPREERETGRLRVVAAPVERATSIVRRPEIVTRAPRLRPAVVLAQAPADPRAVWRTPPALQVFRN